MRPLNFNNNTFSQNSSVASPTAQAYKKNLISNKMNGELQRNNQILKIFLQKYRF